MGICGGCNDCEYVGWLSLIGGVFMLGQPVTIVNAS